MEKITLVLFVLFVSVAMGEESAGGVDEVIKSCLKLYPIEENEQKNFLSNIHPDDADRLAKCFMHCFMDKASMIDEKGNFDVDRIFEITYTRHKNELKGDLMTAIEECTEARNEKQMCDKAYAAVKCVGDKKLW